ncbi:MAG: hypothetical protein ACE5F2_02140 [Candidatus Paceibacteria bacterium]
MKIKYFFWIIVIICVYFAIIRFVPNSASAQETTEVKQPVLKEKEKEEPPGLVEETQVEKPEKWIPCSNPAGCVGKLKSDWPACPICLTPMPPSLAVSQRGGNISEDIANIFKEIRSLSEDIDKIKTQREKNLQEKLANAKSYDASYADTVFRNLKEIKDAYELKKAFVERGGADVEGSLITGFIRGDPVWKKIAEFPVYPRQPK